MTRQRLYNPAFLSPADLKESYVVRQHELYELTTLLRRQPEDGPLQHAIIIGSRGMGKTSLGLRFLVAVKDDVKLSKEWQAVPFFEESYGVVDLAGLWLTALGHLSDATDDPSWRDRGSELLRSERDTTRLAAHALDSVIDFRRETGRRPIFFIENLDDLFSQFRDPLEPARLRAVLQEQSDFLIVGTANSVFSAISNRGEPFYEFFRQIRLGPISKDETLTFLNTFAALPHGAALQNILGHDPGRVEVVRRMTGGNPRLIALSARIMSETPHGSARDDLEKLIDEQTPYFKSRIEALSPQARVVFHALAGGWRPMLAREIAEQTRFSSSLASAHLRHLKAAGYVEEIRLSKERRIRYQVAERFYNIYYLLRFSRDQRERLRRLLEFIEQLFGVESLISLAQATLAKLREDEALREGWDTLAVLAPRLAEQGALANRATIFAEALKLGSARGIDLSELLHHGWPAVFTDATARQEFVSAAQCHLKTHPDDISVLVGLGAAQLISGNAEEAAATLQRSTESIPDAAVVWTLLGRARMQLNRLSDAEVALRKAIEIAPDSSAAWSALGETMMASRSYTDAESAFRTALEKDSESAELWNNLGQYLYVVDRYDEASEAHRTAARLNPSNPQTWSHLGLALYRAEKFGQATEAYQNAIEIDSNSADSWTQFGTVLIASERFEEAENALRRATDIDPKSNQAWYQLARTLTKTRRLQEAKQAVLNCIALEPQRLPNWIQLSSIEASLRDLPAAEAAIREALAIAPESGPAHMIFAALASRQSRWIEALEHVSDALRCGDPELQPALRPFISQVMIEAAGAGLAREALSILRATPADAIAEPVVHAIAIELGETVPPLPAEVMDAVNEVRHRISQARESTKRSTNGHSTTDGT